MATKFHSSEVKKYSPKIQRRCRRFLNSCAGFPCKMIAATHATRWLLRCETKCFLQHASYVQNSPKSRMTVAHVKGQRGPIENHCFVKREQSGTGQGNYTGYTTISYVNTVGFIHTHTAEQIKLALSDITQLTHNPQERVLK